MPRAHRVERLQREILRELSMVLLRGISDPRVARVTLTRVTLAPDLSSAKVFYTAPTEVKTRRRIASGLRHAHGFIQQALGDRLFMRSIPAVTFEIDAEMERTERMNQMLTDLARERRARGGAEEGAAGMAAPGEEE